MSQDQRSPEKHVVGSPPRFKVELQSWDQLTDKERIVYSGGEWEGYLRVTHNGLSILLESDRMEPEDVRFTRDLAWVKDMIQEAYMLGYRDAINARFP